MKKFLAQILIIASLFTLTACFGSDEEPTDEQNGSSDLAPSYSQYENPDFTINHPKEWEILSPDSFTSNVPDTTVVVFRNNLKSDIFTANLSISQAPLSAGTTSEDFALQTFNTQKYNLVGFEELARENYTLGNKDTGIKAFITTFQGRKTITESLVQFEQLCIARNGYGIIITAAYLPNEDQNVVFKLDEMVRSFALKSL